MFNCSFLACWATVESEQVVMHMLGSGSYCHIQRPASSCHAKTAWLNKAQAKHDACVPGLPVADTAAYQTTSILILQCSLDSGLLGICLAAYS